MRAFVALILPEGMRQALVALQGGMPGRHVLEDDLHLTLAFLGDQPDGVLAELHERLEALRLAAPQMRVRGLDVFGGRKPGLVFADVEAEPRLTAARSAVRRACEAAGIALRRERFHPHVTLARFSRQGLSAQDELVLAGRLGVCGSFEGQAAGIGLYRSELGPGGARYDLLAEYLFAPEG
ncbi:RNA 2',3'-cyclic phosphodiesterase [Rhodalgimonas zhirmunskyi]|uniref:RNA 2',3'-cyclic phosphodiesterase n=1 Tax=Rhodalgimonas zhirmunskyi TaxID=2964767 RepID=A0AAJ1U9G3_9RHOB|nr:RNA 2',3'-cyclic phosphodiesterase [Rhodoalgimonas zhirmunskyi]MDQ2093708.1 RNA 2',3'-cyclic phosphodiesterase [Rhodoalgimonas zhirmunskyi]